MAEFTVKRIDEMEGVYGGAFKRARAELGVTAFGMAILDLPPDFEHYPAHNHDHDGQEEVYVALSGGGQMEIDDAERVPLDADHLVRVGCQARRKVLSGADGIRVLILGATPGAAYEAPAASELGGPLPRSPSAS